MNSTGDGGKPAKRRKKDNSDSRVERKRELDRIAQRATRERTKNKIADLEQRLAILESGDKNSEIAALTRTIDQLRNENAKYQNALTKMKFAICEALGDADGTARRDSSSTISLPPHVNGGRHHSMADTVIEESALIEPIPVDGIVMASSSFDNAAAQAQRLQAFYDSEGYHPPTPQQFGNIDVNQIFEFFEYGSGNPFANPSPLTGRMPPAGGFLQIAPDEQKWKTSDDAFNQGLQANPIIMELDEALLARAILLGWESIGQHAHHPILYALRCVDQRVFGKWTSRPQRLALMYICGRAMQWRANMTEENKALVPVWFLPRPAQEKIQHPLVIDFLVWPGLRERLVFEYEKYQADGDFSFCFVEYFHFYWPFPDDQVAQYDETGSIVGMSKLFRELIYDLKNWTMLPQFFQRFPEMKADIGMWVEPPTIGYQKTPWGP